MSARPLRQLRPQYTSEAMHAKIQGLVMLAALVLADGTVGDALMRAWHGRHTLERHLRDLGGFAPR